MKDHLGKPSRVSHTLSRTPNITVPKNGGARKPSQTSPVPLKPCQNCRGSKR